MHKLSIIELMKPLFFLVMMLLWVLPGYAWDTTSLERHIIHSFGDINHRHLYSTSREENARQAIRLGYANFHARFDTEWVTPNDLAIARFIQQELLPFLADLEEKGQNPNPDATLVAQAQQTFSNLANQLTQLLYKNQQRYTNALLLDENAALQETVLIIQRVIDTGSF